MAKSLLLITPQTLKKYRTINKYLNSYLPEELADRITQPLRWVDGRPVANNITKHQDPEDIYAKDEASKMPSPIQIGVDMQICGQDAKKGDKFFLITKCTRLQMADRTRQVREWYEKNGIPMPEQKGRKRAKKERPVEDEGDVPINLPSEPEQEEMVINPDDIPF